MINRVAKDTLLRLSSQFPIVGITGPRQSGKTTLACDTFPDKKYVSFDDKSMKELAAGGPADFLMAFPDGAVIDEAQKVPEIFDGTVEVKSISREAGSRTKIAVTSKDENVDAVGACIGPRGQRVGTIVDVLGGEFHCLSFRSENLLGNRPFIICHLQHVLCSGVVMYNSSV